MGEEQSTGFGPRNFDHWKQQKAWWKCENGHETLAKISNKTRNGGCASCIKQPTVAEGASHVIDQWVWEKNNQLGLDPSILTTGSNKKAWWKCENGHEVLVPIHSKTRKSGCASCIKQSTVAEGASHVIDQWVWEKNAQLGLDPAILTTGSNKKAWWKCENGHETLAKINNKTRNGGCASCIKQPTVAEGASHVIDQWVWEKNNQLGLDPSILTTGSRKNAWWKCENGHEWMARISCRFRANKPNGCPKCSLNGTSVVEQRFVDEILSRSLTALVRDGQSFTPLTSYQHGQGKGIKVDLVFKYKGQMVAFEYDGAYWHSSAETIERDKQKTIALLADGFTVVRIRERDLEHLNLEHDALHQFNYKYDLAPEIITKMVDRIFEALNS